jgi:predicted dehydrogenase
MGLGSMGKRRVRNLQRLWKYEITGMDTRADRREQAASEFGIRTIRDLKSTREFDAVIISTPPQHHAAGLQWSVRRRIPSFVELNVVLKNLQSIQRMATAAKVRIYPSCTFLFHPAIQQIQKLIHSRRYGRLTDFVYHSGNYLPDWHPWESVKNFFVSQPETSGCRELLAFEMNWIARVLGMPRSLQMIENRAIGFGLPSSDSLGVFARFKGFMGVLMIDVLSRFGTRSLTLNLEKAQIRWNWEEKTVKVYTSSHKSWRSIPIRLDAAHPAYNANQTESMYIAEMNAFLRAVEKDEAFPSTLDQDIEVLSLIKRAASKAAQG